MATSETKVELIDFINPTEAVNDLYIKKINWPSDDKQELIQLIKAKFSAYGLVHSVRADKSVKAQDSEELNVSPNSWYAYITFYSRMAAKKAELFLHNNLIIEGAVCRVQVPKSHLRTDLPLAVHKCVELANYYVGFNGWSSQVVYKNLESSEMIGDMCSELYAIGMRLTFHNVDGDISVDGVGLSTAEFDASIKSSSEKRAQAIAYAQKCARSVAIQNAFEKIILVVVDNKKVTARVNTTKVDPFYFNPLWDEENPVVVNVIEDHVSEAEDEGDDQEL